MYDKLLGVMLAGVTLLPRTEPALCTFAMCVVGLLPGHGVGVEVRRQGKGRLTFSLQTFGPNLQAHVT